MTTEIIKLTATELKPFYLSFTTKAPDLMDKVDWSEKKGSVKMQGVEFQCESNELCVTVDFEIDYKIERSFGGYETPTETEVKFHTPIIWDWKVADYEGNEIELDTLAESRLEIELMQIIEDLLT